MTQAYLFAQGYPVVSDQTTQPGVTTTELKNAMALVHNHMKRHETASRKDLLDALDKMAKATNNENWCIYVP